MPTRSYCNGSRLTEDEHTITKRLGASSLVLLAIAFVVAVIVSNQLFKGLRIDLTENGLYTLSAGTKRILQNIDEPINLYFYFSDQATEAVPSLRDYANRVREMLEEFTDASQGKLRLSVIDPLPFSEDEDRAAQFGLQGVQLGTTPDPSISASPAPTALATRRRLRFSSPIKRRFLSTTSPSSSARWQTRNAVLSASLPASR